VALGAGSAVGGASSGGTLGCIGRFEHAATNPRIAAVAAMPAQRRRMFNMWVLFLEAFGAMVLLILIVWWTMFHGRKKGERDDS
jgi:hypothetical protein